MLSSDPGITSLTLYIDSTEIFSRYVLFQESPVYSPSLCRVSRFPSSAALPKTVVANQPYFLLLDASYSLTVDRVAQSPIVTGIPSVALYALLFTRVTSANVAILNASQTSILSQRISSVCNERDLVVRDVQVNQDGAELLALFYVTDSAYNKCPSQGFEIEATFVGNTTAMCVLQYNSSVYPYNYGCRLSLPSGLCVRGTESSVDMGSLRWSTARRSARSPSRSIV